MSQGAAARCVSGSPPHGVGSSRLPRWGTGFQELSDLGWLRAPGAGTSAFFVTMEPGKVPQEARNQEPRLAKALFVDVDVVGVADDGAVRTDDAVWHPWPVREGLALEGGRGVLEVRAKVEPESIRGSATP